MSKAICSCAAAGCNYPEGECAGFCTTNVAKHTQGRLTLNPIRLDQICTADGSACIATANRDAAPPLEVMANARRLVACWNACDGINTELIEAASDGLLARALGQVSSKHDALRSAEAQRDKLLVALQLARKLAHLGIGATDQELQRIDAAIANVKGGAA